MTDMTRRTFGKGLLAGALVGQLGCRITGVPTNQENKGNSRPNVLLLLHDDQSAHLGCLGTRGISTPHADRLAQEGMLFTNAFSTSASCSPTRASILTGMYPHSNGHWRNTISPPIPGTAEDYGRDSTFTDSCGVHEDIPTLVEIVNSIGYVTGITSKFHLSPPWKYPFAHRLVGGMHPSGCRSSMETFLDATDDQPFFLMANIANTHRPFPPHIIDIGKARVDPNAIDVPPELPDTPALRADLAEYFDTVECADACAGAFLDVLRQSGKYENTLIILTSDQGYCYHRAKATAYDDGVRVPFILAGPGVSAGAGSDALVSHIDLVPTILDAVGAATPDNVQGEALWPLLEGGKQAPWRDYVFAEHHAHGLPVDPQYYPTRTVFDGRYQYIRNLTPDRKWTGEPEDLIPGPIPLDVLFAGPADIFPGGPWENKAFEAIVAAKDEFPDQYALLKAIFDRPAEELYDLESDPGEMVNLAQDSKHAARLAELSAAMDAWMVDTNDAGVGLKDVPRRTGDR